MRLIIHQALKDVRLLRWLLLAWGVVLGAFHAIVVYVLAAPRTDAELLTRLDTIEAVLAFAATAAFIVLAAFLVQNDSPATTTTFWVTRPVSAWAMLASKLLTGVVILWALPIVGDIVDLLAAGIDIRWLPASRMAVELAWLLPLMAIAAVTVGLPQFVLVGIIEFLLVAVLSAAALSLGTRGTSYPQGVFVTYPLIALAILLLTYQYLTRRTTRAAVMLGIAPVAIAALAGLAASATADTDASTDRGPGSISVRIDRDSVQVTNRGETSLLDVPLMIDGVPGGIRVTLGFHEAWLQAGKTRIDLGGTSGVGGARATPEETRSDASHTLQPALGGATLLNNPGFAPLRRPHVILIARTRDLESARGEAGILHLQVQGSAWRYRPIASVPLRPGASFRAEAMSGRLFDVQTNADRTTIALREVEAYWNAPYAFRRYLLRNGSLQQAVLLTQARPLWFGYGTGSQGVTALLPNSGGLRIWWSSLDVRWRGTSVEAPSAWLRAAELIAVEVETGERMTRTIEVPLTIGSQ